MLQKSCNHLFYITDYQGSRDGAVARALASHQCVPGSRTRRHMWAEFVGSLLCSERLFSGYSGFPLSSKNNFANFQFDPGMHNISERVLELLGVPWVNKLLYFYLFLP